MTSPVLPTIPGLRLNFPEVTTDTVDVNSVSIKKKIIMNPSAGGGCLHHSPTYFPSLPLGTGKELVTLGTPFLLTPILSLLRSHSSECHDSANVLSSGFRVELKKVSPTFAITESVVRLTP